MFFITDEPILFNAKTGVVFDVQMGANAPDNYVVWINDEYVVFIAETRQECEDFIFSIAGYVGAVNPMRTITE